MKPVWLAISLTCVALIVGCAVWLDNKAGFQDAGNFAALLSAVFSLIATAWLIATVLTQGEELSLQREELSLQRAEMARLAIEAADQSKSHRTAIHLSARESLRASVTLYAAVNEDDLWSNYRSLQRHACDLIRPDLTDNLMQQRGGSIFFDLSGCIISHLFDEGGEKIERLGWDGFIPSWAATGATWSSIVALAREARAIESEDWWRQVLSVTTPASRPERTNAIQAIIIAAMLRAARV